MSNLANLALGPTARYWWDRLCSNPWRIPFILTKLLEERVYRSVAKGSLTKPRSSQVVDARTPTLLLRNRVRASSQVGVVIPARITSAYEQTGLARLLRRLAAAPASPRIVVIDDASRVPIRHEGSTILRLAQRSGPAAARNSGLQWALDAGCDVVFMTDADCLPDEGWLTEGLTYLMKNPYAHVLSGNTLSLGGTWFDRYHELNGTLNGRRFQDEDHLLYGPSCNLAITRQVVERVRFDEEFPDAACEDIEFCCRATKQGFLVLFCPGMRVRHDFGYRPWRFICNIRRVVRQFQRYAKSEGRLVARVPDYFEQMSRTCELPALSESR